MGKDWEEPQGIIKGAPHGGAEESKMVHWQTPFPEDSGAASARGGQAKKILQVRSMQ